MYDWQEYYKQVVGYVSEKTSMKGSELLEYVSHFWMDIEIAFDNGLSPEDCANECF